MNLSFFPITSSDKAFLFALYCSTRADEIAVNPWDDEQKKSFLQLQFQAQQQHYSSKYPHGSFQIISLDNKNIGRLYLCELENEIRIIDLTLLLEYRGQGIGTKLLTDILQSAEKPVRIYLETFNHSIGLFKRLGFQSIRDEGVYCLWEAKALGNINQKVTVFGK